VFSFLQCCSCAFFAFCPQFSALHPLHYLLLFCSYSRSSYFPCKKLHICAIFSFRVITLYIYMYQYDTKDAFMKLNVFNIIYISYILIYTYTHMCVCVCARARVCVCKKNYSINLGLEKILILFQKISLSKVEESSSFTILYYVM